MQLITNACRAVNFIINIMAGEVKIPDFEWRQAVKVYPPPSFQRFALKRILRCSVSVCAGNAERPGCVTALVRGNDGILRQGGGRPNFQFLISNFNVP